MNASATLRPLSTLARGLSSAAAEFGVSGVAALAGRKRFYKEAKADGLRVALDHRFIKSSHTNGDFRAPTLALAKAVAREWADQTETLEPSTMPLFSVCMKAESTVDRQALINECLNFLGTDNLLFYADPGESNSNKKLNEKQHAIWKPILNEFSRRFDDCVLNTAKPGLVVLERHPLETFEVVRTHLESLSDYELVCVESAAQGCKSLVLSLSLEEGSTDVEEILIAARLEEIHQTKEWGVVEGGHDVDDANLRAQLYATRVALRLLRDSNNELSESVEF